jgi:hypothetical protein
VQQERQGLQVFAAMILQQLQQPPRQKESFLINSMLPSRMHGPRRTDRKPARFPRNFRSVCLRWTLPCAWRMWARERACIYHWPKLSALTESSRPSAIKVNLQVDFLTLTVSCRHGVLAQVLADCHVLESGH